MSDLTSTSPAPPRLVLGTTPRQWTLLAVLLALLLGGTGGLLLGRSSSAASLSVSDPVDLGFARDMRVHHAQAVEMSSIVYPRTADPKLRFLAFDILTTQQGQVGLMGGWLQLWGQTQTDSSAEAMAWMGDSHEGPMPGMATREQVDALRTLPVPQMEEQFLRLMIRHHRGAVPMAEYAAERATSADLRSLAATMAKGQAIEIDLMQRYLQVRGQALEPDSGTPPSLHSPSGAPSPSGSGHGTGHG